MASVQPMSYSLKKLITISGYSQRQLAKQTNIPYSTINDFVRGAKNKKLSNYFKLLSYLGIDIEKEISQNIISISSKKSPSLKNQHSEDIHQLLQGLDPLHCKEILTTIVNLHKLQKNTKYREPIERIEQHFLKGGK